MVGISSPDTDAVVDRADDLGTLEAKHAAEAAPTTITFSPQEADAIMRDARKHATGALGPLMKHMAH